MPIAAFTFRTLSLSNADAVLRMAYSFSIHYKWRFLEIRHNGKSSRILRLAQHRNSPTFRRSKIHAKYIVAGWDVSYFEVNVRRRDFKRSVLSLFVCCGDPDKKYFHFVYIVETAVYLLVSAVSFGWTAKWGGLYFMPVNLNGTMKNMKYLWLLFKVTRGKWKYIKYCLQFIKKITKCV